jgi:hypothetical protein
MTEREFQLAQLKDVLETRSQAPGPKGHAARELLHYFTRHYVQFDTRVVESLVALLEPEPGRKFHFPASPLPPSLTRG